MKKNRFFIGVGSILNLFGGYFEKPPYLNKTDEESLKSDWDSLKSDWDTVFKNKR